MHGGHRWTLSRRFFLLVVILFLCVAPSPRAATVFTDDLPRAIILRMTTLLCTSGEKLQLLTSLHNMGFFRWNRTDGQDEDTVEAVRMQLFNVEAATEIKNSMVWLGVGYQSDGSSQWIYPSNSSGFQRPKVWRGNGTAGSMWEESVGGRKSRCGAVERYCLRNWWLRKGFATPARPYFHHWGDPYDPRVRPWYQAASQRNHAT